jgi:hypothetical protein
MLFSGFQNLNVQSNVAISKMTRRWSTVPLTHRGRLTHFTGYCDHNNLDKNHDRFLFKCFGLILSTLALGTRRAPDVKPE